MLLAFRIISYLEGISYLLLLGVGVPLKYLAEDPSWVKSLGMPHGLLFVAYIFLAIVIRQLKNWDAKTMVIVLLASIIPFGTFYVDKKYL
jgi:integral membrane protein|tara:strand:+ start:295 stop:564 length:270 start_codon:yes stop_codon:yes gene_type:complete